MPHFMITSALEHIYFCDPSEIPFMNHSRLTEAKTEHNALGFCSELPGLLTDPTGLCIPVRWHCRVFM